MYGLFNAAVLELQGTRVMIFQVLDITSRKAAEEALDNERIQLRTLINSQPNLVWLKDPDGVYLACNSLFESVFGLPESEILGKTVGKARRALDEIRGKDGLDASLIAEIAAYLQGFDIRAS